MKLYLLYFNDSAFQDRYKKLAGIFNSTTEISKHIDSLVKINGSQFEGNYSINQIKEELFEHKQVEIEKDFCLSIEELTLNELHNENY